MAQLGESAQKPASGLKGNNRVAHVIPEYLPRSATFIHTLLSHQQRYRQLVLAQELSNLAEFPVERAICLPAPVAAGRFRVRRVVRALSPSRRRPSAYEQALEREAKDGGCVLFHAHFGWSGRDSVAASQALGLPLITTFYGRDLSDGERGRFRDPYRKLFEHGALFIVEGPSMAEHLVRIGCPRERIRIIPIGIDLAQFAFNPPNASDSFILIQAARFVEKKGFDLTLRAYAKARPQLGASELFLVGDGPLRDSLTRLVAELKLEDAVRFSGMVSHSEYRQLMSTATACIQPSRTAADGDTEGGAPTVILEMQALGIPVVATRHADIPSVVPRPNELCAEEDVAGLAQALVRIAHETEDERRERVVEARSFVLARHDAAVTAAAIEDLYDEALA